MTIIFIFIIWIISIWLETSIAPIISWFDPNFFFIFTAFFVLRWKIPNTYFIAAFFGITVDSFTSGPFGLFGLTFFTLAFILRWLSFKAFQNNALSAAVIVFVSSIMMNIFSYALFIMIENVNYFSLFFPETLLIKILPSAIVTIPCFYIFVKLENIFNIHFSEKKF